MTFIINQFTLAFYNFINSRLDAYRIMKNKAIAHGVNFELYALFTGMIIFLFKMPFWTSLVFCGTAFCNRQLSFDIPLNIRRGLPWYYQSEANPPAALMDRLERRIFPSNDGRFIAAVYLEIWTILFFIHFV